MSDLAINATEWRSAEWAFQRGLYNDIFEDTAAMDDAIEALAGRLLTKSVPAMRGLKKVFWEGTEHWDELLAERAAISGELILSKEAKDAIGAFKRNNANTFLVVLTIPLALLGQKSDSSIAWYHRRRDIQRGRSSFTDLRQLERWRGENSSNVSLLLLRENWTQKGREPHDRTPLGRELRTQPPSRTRSRRTRISWSSPRRLRARRRLRNGTLSGQFNVRTQFAPGFAKG